METELTGRPLLGTPRDTRLFVDREVELKTIHAMVEANMNVLLLGERGSGKTSLLRQLARRLESRARRAVFVEGGLAMSPAELLTLIRARVSPEAFVPGVAQQLGAALGAMQALASPHTMRRRPEGAAGESELLLETIRALKTDLRDDDRSHVVMLDGVTSPGLVHTVFGRLRDEIWQLPIVWVVAGDLGDRHIYLRPPADAFFARVVTLGSLKEQAALSLLRARIPRAQASNGLLKAIVAASSRTPRNLIRLAADVLVGGVPLEDLANSRAKRDEVVESLGEPAQRLVAELEAHGPASASDEDFLARLGFGRSRAAQLLSELERLGVVESSTEREGGRRPRKIYALRGAAG